MRRYYLRFLIILLLFNVSSASHGLVLTGVNVPNGEIFPNSCGAKGDGKHDDTKVIQSAIDSLVSMGGGTVRLGSGTYLISTINLGPKVSLVGNGNGATVIKQMKDQKSDCIVVKDIAAGLKIADLTILGEDKNRGLFIEQSGGYGENHHYIYTNTSKWSRSQGYKWINIENICIYHFSIGMNIKRSGYDINICNSTFSHNGSGVIMSCTDSSIYNCYVTNNSLDGLVVDGCNNKANNIKSIFNCKYGGTKNAAIVVNGSRCQLVNCETQDNFGKGFIVNGVYNELSNCLSNTDGYGKKDNKYDPQLFACGFQINEPYNTFSNCAVTNYNEKYGAVYHSPVILADSVLDCYPDIYEKIKVLIGRNKLMFHEPLHNVQTLGSKNRVERLSVETADDGSYFVGTVRKNNLIKGCDIHICSLQLLADFKCRGDDGNVVEINGGKVLRVQVKKKSIELYCQGERKMSLDLDDDAILNSDNVRLVVGFSQYQNHKYVLMHLYEKTTERGWIKKEFRKEIDIPNMWLQNAVIEVGDSEVLVKRLAISQSPFSESVFMPYSNTNKIYNAAIVYIDADSCMQ